MANHISALKRIRQNEKRRLHNRYYARTMRNALKDFRNISVKKDAEEKYPKMVSLLDKLVKKNIIHKNKAANLKSKLANRLAHYKSFFSWLLGFRSLLSGGGLFLCRFFQFDF